jgi:glycine hydroxymethyltransferase
MSATLSGSQSLEQHDPVLYDLIEREKFRQWSGLELIASENFTSKSVMECLGSCLTNKVTPPLPSPVPLTSSPLQYAEGYPNKRYYGGNEYIDQIELLCQTRALEAYGLNPEQWGVNVQPYSGSPANFAVYTALLKPHDRVMGLDLPSGGHLTHGYYTYSKQEKTRKAVSATSIYFESLPYRVCPTTGLIDYDALESQANLFKPAMIICGHSAYPAELEYERFRQIADENGSLLMMDMAHISGLVATGEAISPFQYCDIVTTTTHKTLRGPRAGLIFYRKDNGRDFENKINMAVFPGLQGGPHVHQIAAIATQLKDVMSLEFKVYASQVKANSRALASALMSKGYVLSTGGTQNHLLLWDLRPNGLTGSKMQTICDSCGITLNKNTVPGDVSALTPGGVRIGSPALTTRGLKENDFQQIAEFLHEVVLISLEIQKNMTGKTLNAFKEAVERSEEVRNLRTAVMRFITQFPMPGFDVETMKYKSLDI